MTRIGRLKEFLAGSPADPFLIHALALEHVKIGEDEHAKALFDSNLKERPEYVATYYHLGKLLERGEKFAAAVEVYEAGMKAAKAANDNHSLNELRGAADELQD